MDDEVIRRNDSIYFRSISFYNKIMTGASRSASRQIRAAMPARRVRGGRGGIVSSDNHTMSLLIRLRDGGVYPFIIGFLVAAAAGGCGHAHASTDEGARVPVSIHRVIDGDSLIVLDHNKVREVRLWGIDAPEFDQPGSASAKERLKALTSCTQAQIQIKDRDRYGRSVVMLECDGNKVNEAMVACGDAWVHVYYCKESVCEQWKKLERDARKNHLGLWRWPNPVEPWKWKSHRR